MKALLLTVVSLFSIFMVLFACQTTNNPIERIEQDSNNSFDLAISFDFKHGGIASSQYAIWIEDEQGNFVRTIYVTSFTAKGGYSYREDAVPLWVSKAHPSKMIESDIDAITGATPQNGSVTYHWDGTNNQGKKVKRGKYHFYIEGTLFWSSRVLFSGIVDLTNAEQQNIPIGVKYFNKSETNVDMITIPKVKFTLIQ